MEQKMAARAWGRFYGKLKAIGFSKHLDEAFGCEVVEKSGKARFEIPVNITAEKITLKVQVDYMVCQEGMCIPQDAILELATSAILDPTLGQKKNDKSVVAPLLLEDSTRVVVNQTDSAFYKNAILPPSSTDCGDINKAGWDDISVVPFSITTSDASIPKTDFLWFILGAFLAGIVTVFTPCVFPMLPMTVSFFTRKNKSKSAAIKQALIYGASIVAIYTIFGVVIGRVFGAEFANQLSTNWVINLIFFFIFIVFALSFLGMFEITLPNSMVNNVDAKADKGGILGTFFMALALVLVSFSCTGPIIGSIVLLSAQGEWLLPTVTMLAFSVAFALPFTLSAIFPEVLNKLPKSGGWLNSIKVVLGLLELALALKFLSQADQVKDWGILDREVFIGIWIAVFFTISLYLFGKIKFPHDSNLDYISVPRAVLAISSLAFGVFLLPGLWGAPLKSLSGIFPPLSTQEFVINASNEQNSMHKPSYGDKLHIAHNLEGYFDLREAICKAQAAKKPLFIDFTGKTCSNCRLMEQKVWSDPRVLSSLKNDFVIASLYTDFNTITLPASQHYTASNGREITTLGKSLQDFQKTKFNSISLPSYAIVTVEENSGKIILREVAPIHAYDVSIESYLAFLNLGKSNYEKFTEK
jgi:thiol:disulfide interchange protein